MLRLGRSCASWRLLHRCTEASGLQSELGRAQRRQSLQDTIAGAVGEPDRATVRSADPAAAAISTYLAAAGIQLPADTLTAWLSLVPVLALEIGSALAGLLVASYAPAARTHRRTNTDNRRAPAIGATPAIWVASETPMPIRQGADAADHAPITLDQPICADQREILDRLKHVATAGTIKASQRGLARLIGLPQSSLNEKLHALAAIGVIALSTSNAGTAITLHC